MLFKLPNEERIQVEHIECVARPRRGQGAWSFLIRFISGYQLNVVGDQDEVELAHRQLISAMSERP